jgi:DNA ligase (NAD+)
MGQDVTDNIKAISSISKNIPTLQGLDVEVRGEIYMKRSVFDDLRQTVDKSLANPRNAASGSLMAKDPKVTASRSLSLLVYDVIITGGKLKPQWLTEREKRAWMAVNLDSLELVEMQYLPISDFSSLAISWEVRRPKLDYEIDGLVVSLDSLADQDIAGWNGKCPRGKVAYKFKPEQKTAKVLSIDWQVGRTGRLTPMARIEPTLVAGSKISNITLHNKARVVELNVAEGDEVLIEKAGDIIPAICRVTNRNPRTHPTNTIHVACPSCGQLAEPDEKGVNLWCHNSLCPAQLERRVLHYVKTLDMLGVGSETISGLCEEGLVKDVPDLYYLTPDKVKVVTGGDRAAEKVMTAILSKNKIPLAVFLDSLGIDGLGTTTSKDVAKKYKTLKSVTNLVIEPGATVSLCSIEGIGVTTANKIVEGLRALGKMIDRLVECIDVEDMEETKGSLAGLSFCLTGAMSKPRKEIESIIEREGGEVRSSVGKGLMYLVQSDSNSTSSKSEKAKKLGTEVIGEAELWNMIGT